MSSPSESSPLPALKENVTARPWKDEDIDGILLCHRAAYSDIPVPLLDDKRLLHMQREAFPDGQFLIEYQGTVIAYCSSLIVSLDDQSPYKFNEITGASTFSTHDYGGETLYGAEIAVHPDYRGQGLTALLYEKRKELMKRYNLRRMVAYGRLTGYRKHAGRMDAKEYVKKVIDGTLSDPALNTHLKAGYTVKRVLLDFMSDESSLNYATFLEMINPDYDADRRQISSPALEKKARSVRVCAAQYLFRDISTWDEFEKSVRFFAETAQAYHGHFLVLPEYFTAQLFRLMPPGIDEQEAVHKLASWSDNIVSLLQKLAQEYRLYIIGGSTPVERENKLYNVAFLCTPSGQVHTQDKLHITPSEREDWGIAPGEGVKVFETQYGRIAIQVCYDIEFPELSRLVTFAGAEILFVPYSTDEKNGHYRVRYTAQARAVENYLYVVTSGNVGNLPGTHYLLNYGQSAVFTPSDFSFPPQAIAGIADPNTEAVVVTDLDLVTLAVQRELGGVRPLFDRRPDLYDLRANVQVEIINAL